MSQELSLFGVFVPDLLIWVVLAFLLGVPVRWLLGRIGFYRLVWHRALFDTALYILILGGVAAAGPALLPSLMP